MSDDALPLDAHAERAVADARSAASARAERDDIAPADRWSAALLGGGYLAICAVGWFIAPQPTAATLLIFLAASGAHALASKVVFESAAGSAVATQPILVAALLLLPVELVPTVVLAGLLLTSRPDERTGNRLHDLLVTSVSGWHCLGPVIVLAVANLPDVALSHWYVYLLALAAQFAFEASVAVARYRALGMPIGELPRPMTWSWSVDALLAPIGLTAVLATDSWWVALGWASTPIALLALLARDHAEHLEKAVVISEAFDAAVSAARRDALTELANRRAWSEATARAAIEFEADPLGKTVAVLMADLDGLKMVNDLLGHDAGDDLICAAADVLRSAAPADALVARLGGDEFGILLVGSSTTAEELVFAVRHASLTHPGLHGCSVSLSVGIASCPPFDAVEDALVAADQRAFVDKAERRAGRR
jgi:diguanylate cyclase (GGDEF)-like protein